jgi:hypothetical protein
MHAQTQPAKGYSYAFVLMARGFCALSKLESPGEVITPDVHRKMTENLNENCHSPLTLLRSMIDFAKLEPASRQYCFVRLARVYIKLVAADSGRSAMPLFVPGLLSSAEINLWYLELEVRVMAAAQPRKCGESSIMKQWRKLIDEPGYEDVRKRLIDSSWEGLNTRNASQVMAVMLNDVYSAIGKSQMASQSARGESSE